MNTHRHAVLAACLSQNPCRAIACYSGHRPGTRTLTQTALPLNLSSGFVRDLIDNGLGSIVLEAIDKSRLTTDPVSLEQLRAADATNRVLSARWDESLHQLISDLNAASITPVLLKGASLRYRYAKRHQRLLGDIDLLVDHQAKPEANRVLDRAGYYADASDLALHQPAHHHDTPRCHRQTGIWIELHTGLDSSAWFGALNTLIQPRYLETVTELPTGLQAQRLSPAAEWAYVATHWYLHLIENLGTMGLQRVLFDARTLLASSASDTRNAPCQSDSSNPHFPPATTGMEHDPAVGFACRVLWHTLLGLGVVRASEQCPVQVPCIPGSEQPLRLAMDVIERDVLSLCPPERTLTQMLHKARLEAALTHVPGDKLHFRVASDTVGLYRFAVKDHLTRHFNRH